MQDRLWRKTRKFSYGNCVGVDGNRNFDYHWGEIGASTNQCEENYQGDRPLSEPETQIIDNIMEKIKHECKLYLTLHSFGNYLLYPWGFTRFFFRKKKIISLYEILKYLFNSNISSQ